MLCGRTWRLDQQAEIVIMADRQRVTQAMMQYAQNVCEHTPPGSPPASAPRARRIGPRWVEDDGPGVAPEQAAHVFDRFVKGAHRPEGSGLGLSIVAAIAEAHGGRADLRPQGAGGAFEIVLPLIPPRRRCWPP